MLQGRRKAAFSYAAVPGVRHGPLRLPTMDRRYP